MEIFVNGKSMTILSLQNWLLQFRGLTNIYSTPAVHSIYFGRRKKIQGYNNLIVFFLKTLRQTKSFDPDQPGKPSNYSKLSSTFIMSLI